MRSALLLLVLLTIVCEAQQDQGIGGLFGRAKSSVAQTLEQRNVKSSEDTDFLSRLGNKVKDKVKENINKNSGKRKRQKVAKAWFVTEADSCESTPEGQV